MPWKDLILRDHDCRNDPDHSLPDPEYAYKNMNAKLGSVYQCDKEGCLKNWMLADSQMDGLYWKAL